MILHKRFLIVFHFINITIGRSGHGGSTAKPGLGFISDVFEDRYMGFFFNKSLNFFSKSP